MADATNISMGACSVTVGGSDIGHTKGGASVEYEPVVHDVTVDKYGETPVSKRLIGEHLRATVPLAEYTIANLQKAIAAGSTDASKVTIGGETGDKIEGFTNGGVELVLHPLANDASDRSEDVVLYNAVPTDTVELAHEVDNEKVIEITWEALIDENRSDGDQLGLIGDSTT